MTFIYFRRGLFLVLIYLPQNNVITQDDNAIWRRVPRRWYTVCPQQPEVLVDNRPQAICTPVVGGITTIEIAYDSKGQLHI